jgi:hypothetical protein
MKPVVKYNASMSVFDVVMLAKETMILLNQKDACMQMSLKILKARTFDEVLDAVRQYCNLVKE